MANEGYHEPLSSLDDDVMNRHRVISSIMEEFEAIDWYDQRITATDDESLAAVLAHNRDEEKEHAAMAIEWLRRHDPVFDKELQTYLFTDGPITEVEEAAMAAGGTGGADGGGSESSLGPAPSPQAHALRIGSLKNHPKGELT